VVSTPQSCVRPFSPATGIGIGNQSSLELSFTVEKNGVVDDAVSKSRRVYNPPFGIEDLEAVTGRRTVTAAGYFRNKFSQVVIEILEESFHPSLVAFSQDRQVSTLNKGLPTSNTFEKAARAFH
jgi:hypothetical protein